jgi:hypothetical protein
MKCLWPGDESGKSADEWAQSSDKTGRAGDETGTEFADRGRIQGREIIDCFYGKESVVRLVQ